MTLIVDANIVFSIMINPSSKFGEYLLSNPHDLLFISPNFLKKEITKHKLKILEITRYSEQVFNDLIDLIYARIRFYSLDVIPDFIWNNASAIMENNDDKDIPYVAFSLFFSSQIWTGDKSLCKKLSDKGYNPCFTISE